MRNFLFNAIEKCPAGTTYAKDCNTCTCGATPAADKCSKFDCSKNKGPTTTRGTAYA